jgi:acetylornithine deacetylase
MELLPAEDGSTHSDEDGRRSAETWEPEASRATADAGSIGAPPRGVLSPRDREILAAIAEQRDSMEELTERLLAAPTVLGEEGSGQDVIRDALEGLGLRPEDVPMDADALRAHPGHSPFSWSVEGKTNVVATWPSGTDHDGAPGKSLILNGHIDVVSPEPLGRWRSSPFRAAREGDWMYGRGAADMKSGLAAMIGAVAGLRHLGCSPRAPITLESVVEEECTGNGTLQCILAGYTADGAIVGEPFGTGITTSQVGVSGSPSASRAERATRGSREPTQSSTATR